LSWFCVRNTKIVIKGIVSIVTLLCLCVCIGGCYTRCQTKREQLGQYPKFTIAKVVTKDGEVVKFANKKPKAAIIGDNIEGKLKDGTKRTIPLSQIEIVYVSKFDKNRTLSWVISSSVIAVVVVTIVNGTASPFGSSGSAGGSSKGGNIR